MRVRLVFCCSLALAACHREAPPPPTSAPAVAPAGGSAGAAAATAPGLAPAVAAPQPAAAAVPADARAAAERPVAGNAVAERAAAERAAAILAATDLAAVGRAPGELAALGAPVLPVLQDKLQRGDLRERRIAVLALLQLGPAAASVAPTLAAVAVNDPDPEVRAAAEHARRRAVGDTSELDRVRNADEAARARDR
jgi:hypothetical protein